MERAHRQFSYHYLVVVKFCRSPFQRVAPPPDCSKIIKHSLAYRTNATDAENRTEIINDSIAYGILITIATSIQFIAGIFAVDCFNQAALRQITRIRVKFFQSLMKQEIGWYDVAGGSSNFAVRITE